MPSVAIIQTAFIGDVVLATPLFEAARVSNPGATVIGVVRKGCEDLLGNNPNVDLVITWDKREKDRGLAGIVRMAGALRKRHIGTALIPHRSIRTAVSAVLAGIGTRVGFAKGGGMLFHTIRVPYRYGIHEVERNLMLASAAGWRSGGFRPAIFPDDDDAEKVDTVLGGMDDFCVLAPGSVWPTKRWPVESFAKIGTFYARSKFNVVVSGGPGDREVCSILAESVPGALDLCGKLTLRQSAELYRRARFLLTGDTAPQHLAAAVGATVFSIFGPTVRSFGFWPYDENSVVIEQNHLSCRPCGAHGHKRCRIGTHDCMRLISPETVIETIEQALD